MPDWFYRTVSRPVLFRLPAEKARDFALGCMGLLCRLPLGPAVIDLLGHMRADPRLARERLGIRFPTPVGIGPGLDARAVALPALARFGIGFLEVGPVTLAGGAGASPLVRWADQQAVWRPEPSASLELGEALARLREAKGGGIPLVVRVAASSSRQEPVHAEYDHVVRKLAVAADILILMSLVGASEGGWPRDAWRDHLERILAAVRESGNRRPVLVAMPADLESAAVDLYVETAVEVGVAGVLVEGSVAAEPGRLYGLPALAAELEQVRRLRRRWPELVLIASGGVHEPEQALEMLAAGADLVGIDTGLIYTGPGLPKRINEALLYAEAVPTEGERLSATEQTWFWTTLMGAGMLIGSVLALMIAGTRVVLPYDEHFLGMNRAEIQALNPHLLDFMAHDRVSLAGTMTALGVLYLGISLFGIQRGLHWARQSVFASAFVGFATFFLFLGYGYLDTFHAFVTAILFQFLLLGLHSRLGPAPIPEAPQLYGDWHWRMSLWGQLILIGHAIAVLTAGVVIACVGVTRLFVPEDLQFMHTTAEALRSTNPRLVPLIAHDRATFGGMLVASGLTLLLSNLWGFRPCSAWLWWTQLAAVVFAYAAALAVHVVIGYTDWFHLLPVYTGVAVFLLGMGLSQPFLCRPGATAAEWRRFRKEGQRVG